MFITVHAAAATILGKQTTNVGLAFLLGVISHFVLDMIPHGDEQLGKTFFGNKIKYLKDKGELKLMAMYGSIDSVFLAMFLLFLFKNFEFANSDTVIWAIIGGILPDFIMALYKLTELKILKPITDFHFYIHRFLVTKLKADLPLKYGVVMQICFMIFLICVIYII